MRSAEAPGVALRTRRLGALWLALALLAGVTAGPALGGERWGWFGVRIRDLSQTEMEDLTIKLGLSEGYGVVVSEILEDAPAGGSGLRAGDLIVEIDGRPVVETRGLQGIVGGTSPGRVLRVTVLRDGRRQDLGVPVGEMPPDAVAERVAAEFGFMVREATAEAPGEATAGAPPGVRRGPGGGAGRAGGSTAAPPSSAPPAAPSPTAPPAVVVAVAERSAAERGDLRVGDRMLAVNGADAVSVEAFRRLLADVTLRQELRLRVQRGGEPLLLVLPPARRPLPAN